MRSVPYRSDIARLDVQLFGTGPCARLSDWALLQRELADGNFMLALYRLGLDPVRYAALAQVWDRALRHDPDLSRRFGAMMRALSADPPSSGGA